MAFSTIVTVALVITFVSLNGFIQEEHGQIHTDVSRISCDFDQNLCNWRNYSNWEFVDYSVITNVPPPKGQHIIALLGGQKHQTGYLASGTFNLNTAMGTLILWVWLSFDVEFEVALLSPQKTILWSTKSDLTPDIRLGMEWILIEIDLFTKVTQQNTENKTFEVLLHGTVSNNQRSVLAVSRIQVIDHLNASGTLRKSQKEEIKDKAHKEEILKTSKRKLNSIPLDSANYKRSHHYSLSSEASTLSPSSTDIMASTYSEKTSSSHPKTEISSQSSFHKTMFTAESSRMTNSTSSTTLKEETASDIYTDTSSDITSKQITDFPTSSADYVTSVSATIQINSSTTTDIPLSSKIDSGSTFEPTSQETAGHHSLSSEGSTISS
ncbi:uncharacterized protein LOC111089263, partial [Limulus polyphemus]|uniref:Uncharacterized protein LOC111089263 n=1 Tax=Limulus polyphemus TaxID=6850 RepID=A0ABM1TMP6_LIMPO